MADSFFTTRNVYDLQVHHLDHVHAEMLLDAVARRISTLHGPMGAAIRTQRVADICAVAHVLPIDHWKASNLPLPEQEQPARAEATKPKPAHQRLWSKMVANADGAIFWGVIGLLVGLMLAS